MLQVKRSSFGRRLLEHPKGPRGPRSASRSPPWRPPRCPPSWPLGRCEGCHERAVLAAQDHYVWVRVVEVVVELGEQQLFHLSSSPFRHKEEGSATRGVGRGFPPDPPARTAAGARPGSARLPPRAPLPRSDPRPCRLGPFAPLSCGGRSHSLACSRVHLVASWLVPHSRRWARSGL